MEREDFPFIFTSVNSGFIYNKQKLMTVNGKPQKSLYTEILDSEYSSSSQGLKSV
jgi:hypothetical protein